jgi:ABC transporter substrate binding protein
MHGKRCSSHKNHTSIDSTGIKFASLLPSNDLMSYGADFTQPSGAAGTYVGRILRGEKPADLPVQQATRIELLISLRAAKSIGLTFGPFGNGAPTALLAIIFAFRAILRPERQAALQSIPATSTRTRALYRERSDRIAGRDQYLCVCVQYAGQYR